MARDGIVVVKQATWHLGIHDGAMSARELARSAVPGHTIYVLTQPSNPSGFALAPNSVVPMSVGAFLKPAPPDDFTTLPNAKSVFAPNVEDLAVDAVASQLRKLPPWLRWDGSESLLTHAPAPIGGMTTPQLYLKAPGSWTGAHQENLCAASVNISHGPGVSEWAAIPGRAVSRLREAALRDFGFDIWSSEGRYFPPLAWLEEAGIPYTFFRQEPGDMVVLQGDAVHFVSSLGHATHSSWNILTERQLPMAVARTAANVASKQPLVVPLVNLARRWLSSRSDGAAAPVGSLQQADRKPLPIEAASAEVKPQVSHSLLSSVAADASRAGAAQGAPASGGHGAGGDVGGDVGGGGDDDDDDDGLDEDLGLLPTRALPPASVSPVLELLRGGAEEALFDLQPPVLGARASPEPSPAAAASVPIRLAGAIVRGAEHRDVAVARTLAAIPGVAVEAISSERADQVYRCDNLECMAETVFAFASCLVPVLTRRRDKERAKRERSAAAAAKLGADVAPGQWTSGANVDFERSQSRRRWASMKAATESLAPKDRAGRMFRRARDRRATRAPNGVVRPRIMCVTCALTQHVRCGSAVRLYLRHDIAESVGAKPPCDAEPLPSDGGRAQ